MPKVFIPSSSREYEYMFTKGFGWELAASIRDADLVQFTGGSDVSPCLYGEPNIASGTSFRRDMEELVWFQHALEYNIPMAGICRGGQFLNVMCGGRLWQDVDGHIGDHEILCVKSGEVFVGTSTHHQMMRPGPTGEIVCIAHGNLASYKHGAYDSEDSMCELSDDVEAVFYDKQSAFCFQPHPEFAQRDELAARYGAYLRAYLGVSV